MEYKLPFLLSLFLLISQVYSFDEIEYVLNRVFLGRHIDHFLLRVNKETGIYAEFERYNKNSTTEEEEEGTSNLKSYNIDNEQFNILPNTELFEELNKIEFPEDEDCANHSLFDVPYWQLKVNGKNYRGNVGTDFLTEFTNLVKLTEIKEYVIKQYDNNTSE